MNNKLLIPLIFVATFLGILLLLFFLWDSGNHGELRVILANTETSFQLDNGETYSESKVFRNLRVGSHEIKGFESQEGFYYPKTYVVDIKRGQTYTLKIELTPKKGNPDVSGAEPDPFAR